MTRKEKYALAKKNFATISDLITPRGFNYDLKEIKIYTYDIDTLIELAWRIKHVTMTETQVVNAIMDYYKTNIHPANPYIVNFRFDQITEKKKTVLKVFALIRMNFAPKPTTTSR